MFNSKGNEAGGSGSRGGQRDLKKKKSIKELFQRIKKTPTGFVEEEDLSQDFPPGTSWNATPPLPPLHPLQQGNTSSGDPPATTIYHNAEAITRAMAVKLTIQRTLTVLKAITDVLKNANIAKEVLEEASVISKEHWWTFRKTYISMAGFLHTLFAWDFELLKAYDTSASAMNKMPFDDIDNALGSDPSYTDRHGVEFLEVVEHYASSR